MSFPVVALQGVGGRGCAFYGALLSAAIFASPVGAQTPVCGVSITPTATIGSLDDPVSPTSPLDVFVARAANGDWVVAEERYDVSRYSPDGRYLGSFGRRGEGPLESLRPSAVAIDPFDSLWVSDRRGRVIVHDGEGVPARTVLSPDIREVHGFTPAGHPYGVQAFASFSGAMSENVSMFVQVWTREGEPLRRSGLIAGRHPDGGIVVSVTNPLEGFARSDSSFVLPLDNDEWLAEISPGVISPIVDGEAVHEALQDIDPDAAGSGIFPVAATRASSGVWVLGVTRVLSREREDNLIARTPKVRGYLESVRSAKANAPAVSNQVWDGVVMRIEDNGKVSAYSRLDEYPYGFIGGDHLYTFREESSGLIKLNIFSFAASACS